MWQKGVKTQSLIPVVLLFAGLARDCQEVFAQGASVSGVYMIQPDNSKPFNVLCQMTPGEFLHAISEIYQKIFSQIKKKKEWKNWFVFLFFLQMAAGQWSRNARMDLRTSTSFGRATGKDSATSTVSFINFNVKERSKFSNIQKLNVILNFWSPRRVLARIGPHPLHF